MKFRLDSSIYDLEDGRFIAQFLGVVPFDVSRLPLNPYPNSGPVVKWEFHIESGPNVGKPCSTLTQQYPTAKNSCTRMLCGICRTALKEGDEIDPDAFQGCFYAVSIIDGKLDNKFPPQYLGRDMATAIRTFDPDGTQSSLAQPSKCDPISF